MIQSTGQGITFYFPFTESKLGKTGLSTSVYIYRRSDLSLVVNGLSGTELGRGIYYYTLAGASTGTASDYIAIAETATTSVDSRVSYALWVVGPTWVQRLDMALSSIALAVWDVLTSDLDLPGSIGKYIVDRLNATITSITTSVTAAVEALIAAGVSVTFTQTPAEIAEAVQGSRLTIQRDSDWTARLYIAGGISAARDNLFFTVKTKLQKQNAAADSQALLQISEDGGLLYINSAPATGISAKGTLTVEDESDINGNGVVLIELDSDQAALLAPDTYEWDIKEVDAGADLARVEGLLDVVASVTRTIS